MLPGSSTSKCASFVTNWTSCVLKENPENPLGTKSLNRKKLVNIDTMHFPIIELTSEKKTKKEIKESSLDCDDALLNYFCDYYGEEYTPSERKRTIENPWMEALFEGIADVDVENECVRFYSREKILDTLDKYYQEIVDKIGNVKEQRTWLRFYFLRRYGSEFRDDGSIFVVNGASKTSMMFFEDCYYYADKVLYFGQIYDSHC